MIEKFDFIKIHIVSNQMNTFSIVSNVPRNKAYHLTTHNKCHIRITTRQDILMYLALMHS